MIEDRIQRNMSFDQIQRITGGEILDFDSELDAYEIIGFNFEIDPAFKKII